MEDEPANEPAHNNVKEAANYVKAVNTSLQSFVNDIHGFDHYKHQDAWETFLHTLSQLLSKLDSAYFIKMDKDVILDIIPDKTCAAFLARPEEAANKVQQRVSSDSIPIGPEVTSKMRLQKLPDLDKKGQQAITKLFNHLQDTHNHMAEVAKAVVKVSEVSSPEQFTFILQHAVRLIIQLKVPPHLSSPTDLLFEKERLTPEEISEKNCCNLILPQNFHLKFSNLDFKNPMRCLAAAAHFLIRKKHFNIKYPQLQVAKDFAVAEKKLHLAISGRKYNPGKKASKRKRTTDDPKKKTSSKKHTSDVKPADPQPSTSQAQPQDEPAPEQQPQDESIAEQPQDESTAEQQPQDEPISKQAQGTSAAEPQPQGEADDTLTSQSSSDYSTALRTLMTKDPSSIPKKPRYSLRPLTIYI